MTIGTYAINRDNISWEQLQEIFEFVFELLAGRLDYAQIDALTDRWAEAAMTAEAIRAREDLRHLGRRQSEQAGRNVFGFRRKGSPSTAIRLNLRDTEERGLFRDFAPFSIHAEAWNAKEVAPIITAEDSGNVIIFRTDEGTVEHLTAKLRLPSGAVSVMTDI
jgi:hypothetical protein